MMRGLFILGTVLFWAGVAGVWVAGRGDVSAPDMPEPAGEKRYPLAQVAQHSTPEDCWMVISGKVYDLSAYLPEHPSRPDIIEPWCGKEASEAYRTKTRGRRHSEEADLLLDTYLIGVSDVEVLEPAKLQD